MSFYIYQLLQQLILPNTFYFNKLTFQLSAINYKLAFSYQLAYSFFLPNTPYVLLS